MTKTQQFVFELRSSIVSKYTVNSIRLLYPGPTSSDCFDEF